MTNVYQAEIAGHIIRYAFQYPETKKYFRNRISPCAGEPDIFASPDEIARAHALIPNENAEDYAEFKALISLTCRKLLQWDCCIFHSVAFLYRDRAWLLTAPSGTGKSTQFMNWRKLNPTEITMISGDMPALERLGGGIRAHPSPWNGKEDIGSRFSAPLGGIVLLEQGKENRIEPLPTRAAIEALFCQFTAEPETEGEIRAMCRVLDTMLRTPVWKMTNRGDLASTKLLRETLEVAYGTL